MLRGKCVARGVIHGLEHENYGGNRMNSGNEKVGFDLTEIERVEGTSAL